MNILFVEPNGLLGGLYQRAAARHAVRIAKSGQEAIELCDEKAPDAVVLELQLAGNNGIAFLHELRSYAEWREIPVVVHSFVERAKLPDAFCKQFGIIKHFYKPHSDIREVLATVEAYA